MSRVVLGIIDPVVFVDHKDWNGLNNQRSNLRIADISQNNANKKSRAGSSSKYIGVSLDKRYNLWRANASKNNQRFYLGTFKNEIDAALAYNKKAIELHGEFASINIITTPDQMIGANINRR